MNHIFSEKQWASTYIIKQQIYAHLHTVPGYMLHEN